MAEPKSAVLPLDEAPVIYLLDEIPILLIRISILLFILNGAGDENRTRIKSLEGLCVTITLRPRIHLVPFARIELTAFGLGGQCSVLLS